MALGKTKGATKKGSSIATTSYSFICCENEKYFHVSKTGIILPENIFPVPLSFPRIVIQ